MFLNIDWKNFNPFDVIKGCAKAYLVDIEDKPIVVQQVIKYRLSVCNTCPLNEDNWCNPNKTTRDVITGAEVS